MKNRIITIILLVIFFIGLAILTYPIISSYFNSKVQSRAIDEYDKALSLINNKDYSNLFESAKKYNQELAKLEYPLVQYKELTNYLDLININNKGMMGYIEIAKINVKLPIYHGTSTTVLNKAVGHLEGSSLPIGGESTHSILSAHRGLPSSKLFTNLNKLEIGDIFKITILDKVLTYQIDNIITVVPEDIESLKIINDKDYVTLVTCTPYGINTHRLLVRGTRIENIKELELIITRDADIIDNKIITIIISIPIILILILYLIIKPAKKPFKEEVYDKYFQDNLNNPN